MIHSPALIGRVLEYGKRHGFRATLKRIQLSIGRGVAGNRLVLFYIDIVHYESATLDAVEQVVVERKNAESEIQPQDLERIANAWNPTLVRRQVAERFRQGASLWLCKRDGRLAGYGWTITSRTIEPHFFPLGTKDAHLFDFFVFPEHRGQRLNPFLVNQILARLAQEGNVRAFIEAAEWNTAQLRSLSRMPFQPLGVAQKFRVFGRTFVIWSRKEIKIREMTKGNQQRHA